MSAFFLFRPRLFSRALGPGARGEPVRTPRCPWPRSVALVLAVQNLENWQVTTVRHSEHIEPSKRMQAHMVKNNLRQVSHAVFLTGRTDCLAISCSCSSARVLVLECSSARAGVVLVLECSCLCSFSCWCTFSCSCSSARVHARARVFECLCFLCRTIQTSRVFTFLL